MLAVGEAELASPAVAGHYLSPELERRTEISRRELHLAGQDQAADVARGDDLPVDLDEVHNPGLEPWVGAQHLRVTGRTMAEAEVLAHRDVRGQQPAHEHLIDELLGRLLGEALIERDHHELADSEPGDQLGLDLEAGQELGSGLWPDHAERMRLEREDRVAAPDHLAVAEMDAVELADRDLARSGRDVGEHRHLHRPGM
jgi:hypothetical protein